MDEANRNIAIVSSVVYGVLLLCGWIFFCFASPGEPLYTIQSPQIATFYVFMFAFLPSLFFLGGTAPWMCAVYDSQQAAIAFAVVPGGLFVLIALLWVFLGDVIFNDAPNEPLKLFTFRPSLRTSRFAGPYPGMMLDAQGVSRPEADPAGTRPWTEEEMARMFADLRQYAGQDPLYPAQPPPLPVLYGAARANSGGGLRTSYADGDNVVYYPPAPQVPGWGSRGSMVAASLADQSGTTAPVGYESYHDDAPSLAGDGTPLAQPQRRPSLVARLMPSPFPKSPHSRAGSANSPRPTRRTGAPRVQQSVWLDSDAAPEALFSARSSGEDEVYLDIPSERRGHVS